MYENATPSPLKKGNRNLKKPASLHDTSVYQI
jgi:hypothetical protein